MKNILFIEAPGEMIADFCVNPSISTSNEINTGDFVNLINKLNESEGPYFVRE